MLSHAFPDRIKRLLTFLVPPPSPPLACALLSVCYCLLLSFLPCPLASRLLFLPCVLSRTAPACGVALPHPAAALSTRLSPPPNPPIRHGWVANTSAYPPLCTITPLLSLCLLVSFLPPPPQSKPNLTRAKRTNSTSSSRFPETPPPPTSPSKTPHPPRRARSSAASSPPPPRR